MRLRSARFLKVSLEINTILQYYVKNRRTSRKGSRKGHCCCVEIHENQRISSMLRSGSTQAFNVASRINESILRISAAIGRCANLLSFFLFFVFVFSFLLLGVIEVNAVFGKFLNCCVKSQCILTDRAEKKIKTKSAYSQLC